MADISQAQVEAALKKMIDPYLQIDLISAKAIRNIKLDQGAVIIDVELGFPASGYHDSLKKQIEQALSGLDGLQSVQVNIATKIIGHATQAGVKPIEGVSNIIAIASGKGGVGKSATAVNLALALSVEGAQVGLLDADIYGPSQPTMLGTKARPESTDGKTLQPIMSYHLQAMSIGFLIEEDTPMIWRGPMVTQALEQLLRDTAWKDLDYLIVDLPPGTGDTQLTLAQKVPVSGVVIVTTPQEIALLDARKALNMFEKVEIPVLGVVENMSTHICSECGHEEHIFGEGGGNRMAEDYDIDFLGALPLDIRIREETDSGKPTVVAEPDSKISQIYREIARRMTAKLSLKKKDYASKFPNIVIQNN